MSRVCVCVIAITIYIIVIVVIKIINGSLSSLHYFTLIMRIHDVILVGDSDEYGSFHMIVHRDYIEYVSSDQMLHIQLNVNLFLTICAISTSVILYSIICKLQHCIKA